MEDGVRIESVFEIEKRIQESDRQLKERRAQLEQQRVQSVKEKEERYRKALEDTYASRMTCKVNDCVYKSVRKAKHGVMLQICDLEETYDVFQAKVWEKILAEFTLDRGYLLFRPDVLTPYVYIDILFKSGNEYVDRSQGSPILPNCVVFAIVFLIGLSVLVFCTWEWYVAGDLLYAGIGLIEIVLALGLFAFYLWVEISYYYNEYLPRKQKVARINADLKKE